MSLTKKNDIVSISKSSRNSTLSIILIAKFIFSFYSKFELRLIKINAIFNENKNVIKDSSSVIEDSKNAIIKLIKTINNSYKEANNLINANNNATKATILEITKEATLETIEERAYSIP